MRLFWWFLRQLPLKGCSNRHMWATPLAAGPRLSPWEVHPEGGNCREFYRLQAKFAWGTELPAGYQVRADGALYPWPENHLEEGNFEPKPHPLSRSAIINVWESWPWILLTNHYWSCHVGKIHTYLILKIKNHKRHVRNQERAINFGNQRLAGK